MGLLLKESLEGNFGITCSNVRCLLSSLLATLEELTGVDAVVSEIQGTWEFGIF